MEAGTDLTLEAAAARLGVHYMTAYRYVRLGQLQAVKVGGTWRVRKSDVDAFRGAPRSGGGTDVARRGRPRFADYRASLQTCLVAGAPAAP